MKSKITKPTPKDISIYVYEIGQSRGIDFSSSDKIKLSKIQKLMDEAEDDDNFTENMPDAFRNLFYNESLDEKKWKTQIKKILNKVLKSKIVIESWEEGTTGVGLDKKALKEKVRIEEAKSRSGMDF